MTNNKQSIENILNTYGIDSTHDDLLLHGFFEPEDCSVEEKIQSVFANGLKKTNNYYSILSTACLCEKDKPINSQLLNYIFRGRFRVIVHIPQSLENIFFGNCLKKHEDFGNQYTKNCLLDFLELDSIPTEFIVGVCYSDKSEYVNGEEKGFHFIENPNYFNHKTNGKQNTENLIKKITEKFNPLSLTSNLMDLNEKFDFIECFNEAHRYHSQNPQIDYAEFVCQRDAKQNQDMFDLYNTIRF